MVLIINENHEVFTFGQIDKIMEERHKNELMSIGEYSSRHGYPWSSQMENAIDTRIGARVGVST